MTRIVEFVAPAFFAEFNLTVPLDAVFLDCQSIDDESATLWFEYTPTGENVNPEETRKFVFYPSSQEGVESFPDMSEYLATVVFRRWGALHLFWLW